MPTREVRPAEKISTCIWVMINGRSILTHRRRTPDGVISTLRGHVPQPDVAVRESPKSDVGHIEGVNFLLNALLSLYLLGRSMTCKNSGPPSVGKPQ